MTEQSKNDKAMERRKQLENLWDRHTELEFTTKDAELTVDSTMVDNPYVNHIPTLTGGRGKEELKKFYSNHFIPKLPVDTEIVTVSRTIDENRLVEELIFKCTHDKEIDFLLPGVAPTGKYLEIPTIAIVTFEGDKIANEHIYWDQASVLVQLGLLDPSKFPVAGVDSARKVLNPGVPFRELKRSES